jgi:hypothetical protein
MTVSTEVKRDLIPNLVREQDLAIWRRRKRRVKTNGNERKRDEFEAVDRTWYFEIPIGQLLSSSNLKRFGFI